MVPKHNRGAKAAQKPWHSGLNGFLSKGLGGWGVYIYTEEHTIINTYQRLNMQMQRHTHFIWSRMHTYMTWHDMIWNDIPVHYITVHCIHRQHNMTWHDTNIHTYTWIEKVRERERERERKSYINSIWQCHEVHWSLYYDQTKKSVAHGAANQGFGWVSNHSIIKTIVHQSLIRAAKTNPLNLLNHNHN